MRRDSVRVAKHKETQDWLLWVCREKGELSAWRRTLYEDMSVKEDRSRTKKMD